MTTTNTIGITGIDATYYLAKDLERATSFYTALLGPPTMAMPGMVSEWTFAGGESFGLYQPHDAADFHPSGGVLFHVGDIKAAVAAAKAAGVSFDDDGKIEETPVCYMAFGRDDDGNGFLFHQPL
jgi:catechol 2,3-dioxygenase-like lactoylglutathione lyase family enzyme